MAARYHPAQFSRANQLPLASRQLRQAAFIHRGGAYRFVVLPEPRGGGCAAVVNEGIGGNRVLSEPTPGFGINLLARWVRDVLAQPGVRYVLVLEGINDIGARPGPSASVDDLIAAHRQVVDRAHTLRRDTDAVRGRRLLHARGRAAALCAQRVDSHVARLGRRRRLRRRHSRSPESDEASHCRVQ